MLDLAALATVKLVGSTWTASSRTTPLFLGMHDGQRVELKRFDMQDGVGFGCSARAASRRHG
jgi:hypothetical protein